MVRMVRLELTRLRQMILSHSRLPITPHPLKSGTRSGSRTHTPKRQSLNLMRLPIPPFEYRKVVPPPASVSTRGSRYSDTKILPPIEVRPCPSNEHVASINQRKYYMKPLVSCLAANCATSNARAVLHMSFCHSIQYPERINKLVREGESIGYPTLKSWRTSSKIFNSKLKAIRETHPSIKPTSTFIRM